MRVTFEDLSWPSSDDFLFAVILSFFLFVVLARAGNGECPPPSPIYMLWRLRPLGLKRPSFLITVLTHSPIECDLTDSDSGGGGGVPVYAGYQSHLFKSVLANNVEYLHCLSKGTV